MKNLLAYLFMLPVEASLALVTAVLLLVVAATVLITLACVPAHAADRPPPERLPAPRASELPLRDPTRPLASTAPRSTAAPAAAPRSASALTLPQLQLVLSAGDRRYAVIDGELLAVGDSLRGMALLDIHDESVVLKTPNGPRTLPLSTGTETQGN